MKRIIILLELGLFLISISLFSQAYLINTNYCIVSNNAYLIVNGHVNNQSSGNLYLTGTNSNVIIQNNITNDGTINSSGIINLYGDWINNSTYAHNNTSYVYLKGGNQNVGGSATTTFYNLYLQGTGVKTLGNNEFVDGTLNLQDRELATQNYTMTVNNSVVGAIQRTTGFVSSTVGGGLARATNSASVYLFPVGVSGKYRPAEVTPLSTITSIYKVRMANGDASSEGYNRNNKATDICEVNPSFFHIMQQTSGTSNNANIKVYYDNTIDGSWDKVGYYSSNLWNNYTGSSTSSGSPLYYGSANNVSLSSSTPIALTKNAPVLLISASTNPICSGQSTTLIATGADTYSWSHSLGSGASKTVTPSSTTTYTVTGTLANGCSSTASITITVNPLPTVTASADQAAICNGETSVLTATGASTYSWSHSLGSGASKTVTPSSTTTYTVTGTSTAGCTGTATVSVTVNPLPTVSASANPTSICDGETSVLTATGASTYSWSHSLGSGASKTVTPSLTTTYTVTGTSTAGCTGTAAVSVTVNPLPTVSASANPNSVCYGESSILTASSNITGTTFEWSGTLGIGSTKTVTPISTTTYSVTGTTLSGCSSSTSLTITINDLPNTSIAASIDTICNGQSSVLTASGADFYSWSHNLGTGLSQTVSPISTTTYTVTGSFANGCSSTTSIQITVNPIPDIVINASINPICFGDSTTLNVIGDAMQYSWSHSLGSGTTITVSPINNTTYTVTGTNSYGCTNSATIYITVIPNADATIKPVSPLCDNQGLITLNATDTGGVWSGTGIINEYQGLFSPIQAGAGQHIITYIISGQCGDTDTINITVYPSPDATAYATDETCINGNDGIAWVEVAGGTPPYTYLWSTYHTIDSLTNLAPGEYYVTVTDFHNCSDKDTVLINAGTEDCYITHIYIPNIFAPDSKGNLENESLRVYGKGIETIDFTIFDRWGNEVFHTTDINVGWDGTYKGEPALVGDYTYVIKVSYLNGNNEALKGHIYLIR